MWVSHTGRDKVVGHIRRRHPRTTTPPCTPTTFTSSSATAPATANHRSAPPTCTQGRALPVREPRRRRICQDLLINTSQGRGLAGSGSASLGAGYHQQDVALVVDALVVTAAPHPRGTARRESTPRDLAALCAVKAASRGCASKLLDTRLFMTTRTNPSLPGAARSVRRIALPVSELWMVLP